MNLPPIKVINLARRPDRASRMERELRAHDITRFTFIEAVDGDTLIDSPELRRLFEGNDFGTRRGMVGSALSHYRQWTELASRHDFRETWLILEDDITLTELFREKLSALVAMLRRPETGAWDIMYLGYSMFEHDRARWRHRYDVTSLETRVAPYQTNISIGGSFAYLLNVGSARKLVEFISSNGIRHGVDYLPKAYGGQMGLVQLETRPHLVFSECCLTGEDAVDTDIQTSWEALF